MWNGVRLSRVWRVCWTALSNHLTCRILSRHLHRTPKFSRRGGGDMKPDKTHMNLSRSWGSHAVDLSASPYLRSNHQVPWHVPTHPRTKLWEDDDVSACHSDRTTFPTFSDAVGFVMSDDCGLDERPENLSGSKLVVLYGLDDLQTYVAPLQSLSKELCERLTAFADDGDLFSGQMFVCLENSDPSFNRSVSLRPLARDDCLEGSRGSEGPNHSLGGSLSATTVRVIIIWSPFCR